MSGWCGRESCRGLELAVGDFGDEVWTGGGEGGLCESGGGEGESDG
jgi:hypothetical protein